MPYAYVSNICIYVWNCSDVYAYWRIWWKSVSSTRRGGVNTHKPSILQTALVVLAQHPPQHVSCVGSLCIASWTVGLQSQEAESQAPWNVPPQLASCDCLEVRTSGWQLTLGWLPVLFVSLCISLSHILNGRALPVDQRCLSRLCKTTLEVLKQVHIISCRHTSKLQTQKHSGRLTGLCYYALHESFLCFRVIGHVAQFLFHLDWTVMAIAQSPLLSNSLFDTDPKSNRLIAPHELFRSLS